MVIQEVLNSLVLLNVLNVLNELNEQVLLNYLYRTNSKKRTNYLDNNELGEQARPRPSVGSFGLWDECLIFFDKYSSGSKYPEKFDHDLIFPLIAIDMYWPDPEDTCTTLVRN